MTFATSPFAATAQDDIDDLLKQLDGESAAKAEAKAEPAAEAPAAAEPAAGTEPAAEAEEAPAAEPAAAEPAEPKAEKPAADESSEPAPAAEPTPEEVNKKVDDVLSLLDDLDEEAKAEEAAKPAAEAKPAADEPAAKPAADEPAEPKAEKPAADESSEPKAKEDEEAATSAAATAKPKKRTGPDAELIENIVQTERLRRASYDEQAKREIVLARECMESKDFQEAVRHYGLAIKLLNDSASAREFRKECESGIAEGLYRAALQEDSIGRRAKARELMEKALEMRHPKARRVLEKWQSESTVDFSKTDFSEVSHRSNESDYKADREVARRHLRRARQYLALRDIPRALNECEVVLKKNPNNQEAIRLRDAIQSKRQVIHEQTREATRKGMIADVDDAWRPVYAVNAGLVLDSNSETVKTSAGDDPERTQEQDIVRRMRDMRLPTIEFKPPATIIEAIDFFRTASRDYDRPDIPIEKRGFNFVLRTPVGAIKQQAAEESADDFSATAATDEDGTASGLPPIPKITASDISFYDALKLVCDSVDYKFIVSGPVIMVMQKDMSTAELISRKYNVPEAFVERVNSASEEIREMGGFGSNNRSAKKSADEGESADRDWKAFFEEMGVKWPEGSSIKHIKSLGKLYVRNTSENLAEFEKVIDELGGQPQLIEIETRFVEVSQEDLNSLGFEWILNSDYALDLTGIGRKALGLKGTSKYGSRYNSSSVVSTSSSTGTDGGSGTSGGSSGAGNTGISPSGGSGSSSSSGGSTSTGKFTANSAARRRSASIGAIGGVSDFTDTATMSTSFSNGNRYLSTTGNHISGQDSAYNDQFMRVNAFLGQADLSMILHMLSQRSDTDLLSAPKVVTKSGEQAVIKVVTEYIYPQDYNVQLQSSSSSGSSSSSSSRRTSPCARSASSSTFCLPTRRQTAARSTLS